MHCDPDNPSRVIVGTGYAVGCCGDDIVVCEPTGIDLGGACLPEGDPCADPRQSAAGSGEEGTWQAQRMQRRQILARSDTPRAAPGAGANVVDGKFLDPCPGDWCAVDLYVRYKEEHSDPQTALRRGSCDQLGRCEYSRTKETFELYYEAASDPDANRAEDWCRQYEACSSVISRYFRDRASFPKNGGDGNGASRYTTAVRGWLLRWIDLHPLHQFCFLRDVIRRLDDDAFSDQETVLRLLLWLIQDCRNEFLRCDCPVCDPAAGVRLARISLAPDTQAGLARSRVAYVDPYPPHRRLLGRDSCLPAEAGTWNLGGLIWHQPEEVCTALSELGLRPRIQALSLPGNTTEGNEFSRAFGCCPIVHCGVRDVTVYVVEFCDGSERVFAICEENDYDFRPSPMSPERETVDFAASAEGAFDEATFAAGEAGEPAEPPEVEAESVFDIAGDVAGVADGPAAATTQTPPPKRSRPSRARSSR